MSQVFSNYDYRYEEDELDTSEETIFIRTSGNDADDGKTSATAFLTIQRALKEIPIDAQYARVLDIGSGSFDLPRRIVLESSPQVATGQSNPVAVFKCANPVESASMTVANVVSFSKTGRIVLQITGAAWVINEHVGKKVRFSSDAWNNQYAIVKANSANTLTISCGKINGFATPIVNGNTLVFVTDQTVFTSPYTTGISCQFDACKVEFINANWNISGIVVFRHSTAYFTRNTGKIGCISISTGSFVDFQTTYIEESTTLPYLLVCFENASMKFRKGSTLNGKNVANSCVFIRNLATTRFEDELCLMNFANGIRHLGSAFQPDWSEYAFIDWLGCTEGIKSGWYVDTYPATGLPLSGKGQSLCYWPEMYGSISGNFLIDERAGGIHYIPSASQVTTALGTNTCSVDGTNEGYIDLDNGSHIYLNSKCHNGIVKQEQTAGDLLAGVNTETIVVTNTAAPRLITLPTESAARVGKRITIKDGSGGALINNISIVGQAAEPIDGNPAGAVIAANWGTVTLESIGSAWSVIG